LERQDHEDSDENVIVGGRKLNNFLNVHEEDNEQPNDAEDVAPDVDALVCPPKATAKHKKGQGLRRQARTNKEVDTP
jgi:hypothetical protein